MSPPTTAAKTMSYAHSPDLPSSISRRWTVIPDARKASAKHRPKVLMLMPRTVISGFTASKVVQGIRHGAVDAHLDMQVRAEAAAGAAGQADHLALADVLAHRHADRRL